MAHVPVTTASDGTALIARPIMRGSVPDYKATAQNLAAQVLVLNHALDEAQSTEAQLCSSHTIAKETIGEIFASNQALRLALASVQSHWTHHLAGKSLKTVVKQALVS